MPVLDSNLLIRLSQGDVAAAEALQRLTGQDLTVPFHAAAEYLVAIDDVVEELRRLHRSFRMVHTTDDHILAAAALRADARARAVRPRWGDIHIAAAAVVDRTYVVTTNKRHFRQLNVEAWHYLAEPEPPSV